MMEWNSEMTFLITNKQCEVEREEKEEWCQLKAATVLFMLCTNYALRHGDWGPLGI